MTRGQYGLYLATRTVATLYVYDMATRVLSTVVAPTSHGPAGLFWSNIAEGGRAIMIGAHGETVAAARDPQSGTYGSTPYSPRMYHMTLTVAFHQMYLRPLPPGGTTTRSWRMPCQRSCAKSYGRGSGSTRSRLPVTTLCSPS